MSRTNFFVYLLLGCATASVTAQPELSNKRLEKELVARLNWESIWADSGVALRYPPGGSTRLTLYLTAQSLTFCSHDLGICESYQMKDGLHLGKGLRSVKCDVAAPPCGPNDTDDKALREFALQTLKISIPPAAKVLTFNTEMPHGLAGGIVWPMTMHLEAPEQVVQEYKRSPLFQMETLRRWLLDKHKSSGYASIIIACYQRTDPIVYLYGDRPKTGPIVFEAFWDDEIEQWAEAGFMDGPENQRQIEQMKGKVTALACGKVVFR